MRVALDEDIVVAPEESVAFFSVAPIELLRVAAV